MDKASTWGIVCTCSQNMRLRIYFYLPEVASRQMIEQAKLMLLSEFSVARQSKMSKPIFYMAKWMAKAIGRSKVAVKAD